MRVKSKLQRVKKVLIFGVLVLGLVACNEKPAEDTKEKVALGKSFGPEKVVVEDAISVKEMLADYEGKTEPTEYTFEAKISEVCSKAGCWINVDKGNGETFMVRFKDHFTIPIDTKVGSEAYLHGIAYWDTISVEMLQHFAYDAGETEEEINKITEPSFELSFEADGITLKK